MYRWSTGMDTEHKLNKLICIHYLNYWADGYYSTGSIFCLQICIDFVNFTPLESPAARGRVLSTCSGDDNEFLLKRTPLETFSNGVNEPSH